MTTPNPLLPNPFIEAVDRYHFHVQGITTVRLEAPTPLPVSFIQEIQQELGLRTIKFGRFTWTKFPSWENALEFYLTYNGFVSEVGILKATPVDHQHNSFQRLIEFYTEKAQPFGLTPQTILRY